MKTNRLGIVVTVCLAGVTQAVYAHDLADETNEHPHYDRTVKPPTVTVAFRLDDGQTILLVDDWVAFLQRREPPATGANLGPDAAAEIAAVFKPFAPKVVTRWDDQYFYVESDGMPEHRMMVGITAWQQQVPLPQPYTGNNAWRFPLHPTVAKNPLSAKSHFFRGAIALAANGVPIFNPIKNDGRTDTLLAGELDEFGGHAGRADDYHYHIAPVHLQKIVGDRKPVAFALDGYPIYGYSEPDGSPPAKLDAFNGHADAKGNYHYHATKTYPYLNGGFHGEVVERGGQVDPQPRAEPVRPDTRPLRDAKITEFTIPKPGSYSLEYKVGRETRYVNYSIVDGTYRFDFVEGAGKVKTETYTRRGGGDRKRGPGRGPREREEN